MSRSVVALRMLIRSNRFGHSRTIASFCLCEQSGAGCTNVWREMRALKIWLGPALQRLLEYYWVQHAHVSKVSIDKKSDPDCHGYALIELLGATALAWAF